MRKILIFIIGGLAIMNLYQCSQVLIFQKEEVVMDSVLYRIAEENITLQMKLDSMYDTKREDCQVQGRTP